jgi:hypothetical protein
MGNAVVQGDLHVGPSRPATFKCAHKFRSSRTDAGGFDQTAELWRNRIGGVALTVLLYLAGEDFTRAIERWGMEHGRDAGDPTGRSVRPHMRRAHSHLYWTGAGRAVPRVRFLLPISVKGRYRG